MSEAVPQFVHLHVHTDYSQLDGLSSPEGIVELASKYDMPAVAITDHGNMGGFIKAFSQARKIQKRNEEDGLNRRVPQVIPGLEAYHAVDRFGKGKTEEGKQNYHLILLAVTDQGYQNLMRITSESNMRNSVHFKPRVDLDLLRQYSEGIVCTTSCLGSSVNQALIRGNRELAKERAQELLDIFGPDRFFIEIQDHGIKEQLDILDDQVWLASELGVGLLAAQDSHYDHQEDHEAHDALLAIGSGSTLDDPDRFKFDGNSHHFRTTQEMIDIFPEDRFPGAIANSLKIAEMAQGMDTPYKKPGHYLLPHFPLPDGFEGGEDDYLKELTYNGLVKRYGDKNGVVPDDVKAQADYELGVIKDMGFPGYFLILSDGLSYIKSRGHIVGPGRGSAAGSIVAYAVNITSVPPNEHGLFFERFLNPGRRSMPDIDVDLTEEARDELTRYYISRFGERNVSKIGTIGSYKARKALQSSFKIVGVSVAESRKVSSLYPADVSQIGITLNDLMKRDRKDVHPDRRRQWSEGEAFRDMVLNDRLYTKAVKIAMSIEGKRDRPGVHAGGLLITPGPVSDYFPTIQHHETGFLVTQYDKDDVEDLGGVKIDFLGLSNLALIQRVIRLVQDDLNIRIDLDNLPFDDPGVYRMIANGDTEGVFQLVSDGMRSTLRAMAPTGFGDISAALALFRPGPMSMNTHMEYGDRKNGRKQVEVFHPEMMDILRETYGLVVYQEQVMALARQFAGYSLAEADDFRKAMGKKSKEVMDAQHEKFIAGVVNSGYEQSLAQSLWDTIEPFSGYAFNKAHSVAYGYISYWTAYLKHHYPAQYAAGSIEYLGDDGILAQVDSARRNGINVYAPDINNSKMTATTSRDSIWLGMGGVSNCGDGPINAIVVERNSGGQFKSLPDFLVRTRDSRKVNRRNVESLIHAGAFDSLHPSRKVMVENLDNMLSDAKNVSDSDSMFSGESLFDLGDEVGSVMDSYDLSGPEYDRETKARMELQALGFFAGHHPFSEIEPMIEDMKVTGKLPQNAVQPCPSELKEGDATIYGIVTGLTHHKGKGGKLRSSFVIETAHDKRIDCIVFGYHLSDSLAGSFVVAEVNLRTDSYDEESESLVATAKGVDRIDVDKESERAPERRRRALKVMRGGKSRQSEVIDDDSKPRRLSSRRASSIEAEHEEEDDRPMIMGDSDSEPEIKAYSGPKRYRFYVTGAKLRPLSSGLAKLGAGQNQAYINFGGEDVIHDHLKFDIDDNKADKIASELGIEWDVVE